MGGLPIIADWTTELINGRGSARAQRTRRRSRSRWGRRVRWKVSTIASSRRTNRSSIPHHSIYRTWDVTVVVVVVVVGSEIKNQELDVHYVNMVHCRSDGRSYRISIREASYSYVLYIQQQQQQQQYSR